MSRPLTLTEAMTRGLVANEDEDICTCSNGTAWEGWADANCWECQWYDPDTAGELCAFEGASLLAQVSPELAGLFGWIQHEQYPDSWREPERCPFWTQRRRDDNGNDRPPDPEPDPNQLVLFADPTEDAAMLEAVTAAIS